MADLTPEIPAAWCDPSDGRIYLNGRRFADLPYAMDPDASAVPLFLVSAEALAAEKTRADEAVVAVMSAEALLRLRGENVERLYAERDELEERVEKYHGWWTAESNRSHAAEAALSRVLADVEALGDEYAAAADRFVNSHLVQRATDLRRHAAELRALAAKHRDRT